jgi:signal transduction histidine kinase
VKLSLKTKTAALILCLVTIVGIDFAVVANSWDQSRRTGESQVALLKWSALNAKLDALTLDIRNNSILRNNALLVADEAETAARRAAVVKDHAFAQGILQELMGLQVSPSAAKLRQTYAETTTAYLDWAEAFTKAPVVPDDAALTEVTAALAKWVAATSYIEPYLATQVREATQANLTRQVQVTVVIAIAAITLVGLALALGVLIFRLILNPIVSLAGVATSLSRGAVTPIGSTGRGDEIGTLATALREWSESINRKLSFADLGTLAASHKPDVLLQTAASTLRDTAKAAIVNIWLDNAGLLVLGAKSSDSPTEREIGSQVEEGGPTKLAATSGKVITGDFAQEPWSKAGASKMLGPFAAIPLFANGELVGVAMCVRRLGTRAFSADEVAECQFVLSPLASSVQVIRLVTQLHATNLALEAASRHKNEFLATMSHELRTPLNSVLGFSQLLQMNPGKLTNKYQRYISNINVSGNHLLALVNDVLDIAKISAGHLDLDPTDFELDELLDAAAEKMAPMAGEKGVRLTVVSGAGSVHADRLRTEQVALNLLSNAIKFTNDGGTVTVSHRSAGSSLEVEVTDTGVGIAKEHFERIFEAFTQVEAGKARAAEGTGLGLSLSRNLVTAMGGTIAVKSRLGHGSTFTFTLPAGQIRPAASGRMTA